ncbi:MAG TPA: hypothetical protein VEA37_02230 [Flavobacterium sp.]|nr:hypothetical protein [Flavobacterium sp.]
MKEIWVMFDGRNLNVTTLIKNAKTPEEAFIFLRQEGVSNDKDWASKAFEAAKKRLADVEAETNKQSEDKKIEIAKPPAIHPDFTSDEAKVEETPFDAKVANDALAASKNKK